MRRLGLVSTLLILAAVSLAAADAQPTTVTLSISGMHCEGCASGITAMLKRTDGVVKADVSYEARSASTSQTNES